MHELLDGPGGLRHPTERLAFWLTLPFSIPVILVVGFVLHESIGASQVALFVVAAMIYVTLARGRLLGSSVLIHDAQYPRVFALVKRTCAMLEIPLPLVFAREDNIVPVAALGFGEPYALVISSHWIELFDDRELAFMIGRELGHIAVGHTRFLSLLSVNGNENPLISFIFGAWLRRCTYTCDKIGLLCCGSIDAAVRAIALASFHEFGRKIDYAAFAEQAREVESDQALRWGEWLSSEPYATVRIGALQRFVASPAFARAAAWFAREHAAEPPALPSPGFGTGEVRDCAGWWRRVAAFSIDAVVVSALITAFGGHLVSVQHHSAHNAASISIDGKPLVAGRPGASPSASPTPSSTSTLPAGAIFGFGPFLVDDGGLRLNPEITDLGGFVSATAELINNLGASFWFPGYIAVLIGVAGQTFGMMISGLRVMTVDFRRPTIGRVIWRSVIVFFAWWAIAAASLIWRRILLHDRLSKTRVVKVERMLARATRS